MARPGHVQAGAARRCTGVPAELFDFREPLPLPAAASRLVAAVEEAAPRVGLLLGLACGRNVAVTCPGVRRVSLVEVATAGSVWTPLSSGLPEPALLLVSAEGAVALADLYLGGLGEGATRPCSPLEQELLVRHTVPALRPLATALADHGVNGLTASGPCSDEALPAAGEVVAVPLDVELPLGTVRVTLCLPAKSLLPSESGPQLVEPSPAARSALSDVPVELAVRLSASVVSAQDVEDLRPGDVITLDPDAADHLLGVLAGDGLEVPVLGAALGRRGDQRALLVHSLRSVPGGL